MGKNFTENSKCIFISGLVALMGNDLQCRGYFVYRISVFKHDKVLDINYEKDIII